MVKWNQSDRGTIGYAAARCGGVVAGIIRRERKCTEVENDIIALMPNSTVRHPTENPEPFVLASGQPHQATDKEVG